MLDIRPYILDISTLSNFHIINVIMIFANLIRICRFYNNFEQTMNRTVQLIETEDGSHTIYLPLLNERYHSSHGAIQESKHVFIEAGLKSLLNGRVYAPLNILEIGFGTGLNALLTILETGQFGVNVNYTTIEAYPLSNDIVKQLNYAERLNIGKYNRFFDEMHACEWNKTLALLERFSINKMHTALQEAVFDTTYHLVYFDAFSPTVQPEMWTDDVFQKLYNIMQPESCLVTYCAKGEVKRTLKRVGFKVEALQGPPGKREMIRALKLGNF